MIFSLTFLAATAAARAIDFAAVHNFPTPTLKSAPLALASQKPTYASSKAAASAAAAVVKDLSAKWHRNHTFHDGKFSLLARSGTACDVQPVGSAPTSSPDTPAAFLANGNYSLIAQAAPVPAGYKAVYQNLTAATESAGYLGYYTLPSYDTTKCAQLCTASSSCLSFNTYIERDPSLLPGPSCANPASTANYKCALFGLPITPQTATNQRQYRTNFVVVIAGSNGYTKGYAPPTYANFTAPVVLNGAINAPIVNGTRSTYLGVRTYSGPFDPSQCAAACQAVTKYNAKNVVAKDGTYSPCNFFNAWLLSQSSQPLGTYCAFYTQAWNASYATNTGQFDDQGVYYNVSNSVSYTLSPLDPGVK